MNTKAIDNTSFGILKGIKPTHYGYRMIGEYKGHKIEVFHDKRDETRMIYQQNDLGEWVKSKLEYFKNGIKKVIWSYAK